MGCPFNAVNLHYYFIMRRNERGLGLLQHWQCLIQPKYMIKAGIYDFNCQRKLIVNWELWIIMAFATKLFFSYLSQDKLQRILLSTFSSQLLGVCLCKWKLIYTHSNGWLYANLFSIMMQKTWIKVALRLQYQWHYILCCLTCKYPWF